MTLEYYNSFIAIAECGSILAAAQKLSIAQPALSNQLKVMEREYGAKLAIRGARGVTLTPEGQILYQKAKSIAALEQSARDEIRNSVNGITGTLSVALPPSNSEQFMEQLFSHYCREFPDIRLQLHELTSNEVARYVKNGVAEIGVIRAPIADSSHFDFFPLSNENVVAFLPHGHPLSRRAHLSAEDLKQAQIAIPRGCITPIRELCAQYAFEPEFTYITTSRTVALHLAQMTGCAALIPEGAGKIEAGNRFLIRKFTPYSPAVPRAVITGKDKVLSQIAQTFLKFVCDSIN